MLDDGSLTPVEPGVAPPRDPRDRALASTADVELDLAWRLLPASATHRPALACMGIAIAVWAAGSQV